MGGFLGMMMNLTIFHVIEYLRTMLEYYTLEKNISNV